MYKSRRKIIWIILLMVLLVLAAGAAVFMGRKPFKDLNIASVTVKLSPPDETIQIAEPEALEELLEDVVIYRQDDSYREYAGQAVTFSLTLEDGSQMLVTAYNPFIIIDGVGYRCKYEPCERLSSYANRLHFQIDSR